MIGYSEYSDVAYLQAVARPTKPDPPKFVSATDTTITVQLFESLDTNGVDIVSYEVERDAADALAGGDNWSVLLGAGGSVGVPPPARSISGALATIF